MRLLATVLLLIGFLFTQAQNNELTIQGQTGKLYLEHTVVAKENWYSVGRLYNVNPKELAPFNHLTLAQGLAIGQTLEIPLTAVNFSQNGAKAPTETLVPVYHVVAEKEWMYRISVNHNKVPIPTLEKWNHITGAQLKPGMRLIVGYLRVKTAQSAFASGGGAPVAVNGGAGGTSGGGGVSGGAAGGSGTPVKSSGSDDELPGEKLLHASENRGSDSGGAPVLVTGNPDGAMNVTEKKNDTAAPPVVAAPVKTVTPAPKKTTTPPAKTVATTSAAAGPAPHFNGGVFRTDFSDGGKSATGQAGIFKSTSGWQDGKYYALMNNVPVGTIIKISDPATAKTVYAKVLGQLPDMKESAGLLIRMSNAASAELGEGEGKFSVGVNY